MAREERAGAEGFLPSRPTLPRLRTDVQECRGCDLHRDATQAVFGDGARRPRLVIVGEQPGDVEDCQGAVRGPGWQAARQGPRRGRHRAGLGLPHQRCQALPFPKQRQAAHPRQARPPAGHRLQALALLAELEVLRPSGVVSLGATAGQSLLGASFRVGTMRGKPLEAPDLACDWVVATTHPSAALRADNREEVYDGIVADLRVVAAAIDD